MIDPIQAHIHRLERQGLNGTTATPFDPAHLLNTQSFLHIMALADFWSPHPEVHFTQYMIDLAISAHCQNNKLFTLVFAGTPQKFSIYLSLGSTEMTQLIIEGILPGIRLEIDPTTKKPLVITNLAHRLAAHFTEKGVISGIPSQKVKPSQSIVNSKRNEKKSQYQQENNAANESSTETQSIYHLERVVRGMAGATWAYVVCAYPRPREVVADERMEIIDALANASSQIRGQVQKNTQTGQSLTASKTASYTETLSGELINYRAQYLVQLLERELQRHDTALSIGQWTVDVHFGAAQPWQAQRLAALLVGTLAGTDSRPDPLRSFPCTPH